MSKYFVNRKLNRLPKKVVIIVGAILLIFIVGSVIVRGVYNDRLKPVSNSSVASRSAMFLTELPDFMVTI